MTDSEAARVLSVNVGRIREVQSGDRTVTTGIYKSPVDGPIRAVGVNLEGDDQADRSVHGGPDKAVYGFPSEHYDNWREAFPSVEFAPGAFGENLTTAGLTESTVFIGDMYRCGSVVLRATQPRQPCFKFAIRLGDKRVGKHMIETGQTGFYFSIVEEGVLEAGDAMVRLDRPSGAVPVSLVTEIYGGRESGLDALRAVHDAPGLPESWREWLAGRIAKAGGG